MDCSTVFFLTRIQGLRLSTSLQFELRQAAAEVEGFLEGLLPAARDRPLLLAMRYAALRGGKRLRPFLTMQSAALFGVAPRFSLRVGAALEILHVYSLVHDDLPAMDDSNLRRGRPSVHRKFGQATAILTGDALLTLAFGILSNEATHSDSEVRCMLIESLSEAAGYDGMIGGQALDLEMQHTTPSISEIYDMQSRKTAALFSFACTAGAILAKASCSHREALASFGREFGRAFQLIDDLLDVTGDRRRLGKPAGHDAKHGKASLVRHMNVEETRKKAETILHCATERLAIFGQRASLLRAVGFWALDRRT